MIGIYSVTEKNYRSILELGVSEDQEDFIESPYECLADAKACKQYKPVGLTIDGELAGFAMYGYFPSDKKDKEGRLWLDRFLVDERFQGKGLGKKFFQAMIHKVETDYGKQPIYLSVYKSNEVAIRMYKKFGFVFNNERDINGEWIMVKDIGQEACKKHA